jgi:hypothetical protein
MAMKTGGMANRERIDFEYSISTMIILPLNYSISMLLQTLPPLFSITLATRKADGQLAAGWQP